MEARDFRDLTEAYYQVYQEQQLDEISQQTATRAFAHRATGEFEYDTNPADQTKSGRYKSDVALERIKRKFGKAAGEHAERAAHAQIFGRKGMPPKPGKTRKEQYDLYDLILSHLLYEGYAETSEAAEVMMVNMSEDWREMIFDECELDEGLRSTLKRVFGGKKKEVEVSKPMSRGEVLRQRYNVGPDRSDTSAKRQILNRSRARAERDERQYGDSKYSQSVAQRSKEAHNRYLKAGYSKYGADDARGKGSKARRRAEALTREEYEFILSYLIDEGYTDTIEGGDVILENMSEDWIDSVLDEEYLYEMRKEDKVAGKKKTPLMVPGKRGTIQKTESGGWKKQTPMVGNPKVSMGRQRQGGGGWKELYGYQRHSHGGAHDGMGKGSERGKKQVKGLKPGINTRNVDGKKQVVVGPKAPKTPVEKFKAQKQENEYTTNANYSKSFRDYNTRQPSPTRLDVLRKRREARMAKKES